MCNGVNWEFFIKNLEFKGLLYNIVWVEFILDIKQRSIKVEVGTYDPNGTCLITYCLLYKVHT